MGNFSANLSIKTIKIKDTPIEMINEITLCTDSSTQFIENKEM